MAKAAGRLKGYCHRIRYLNFIYFFILVVGVEGRNNMVSVGSKVMILTIGIGTLIKGL